MADPEPAKRRPPVAEVALGVQFSKALPLGIVELGLLAREFAEWYPTVLEQPPLPRAVELAQALAQSPDQEFSLYPPRLWLISTQNDALVQIQSDRFILNWRRTRVESDYPGFPWVKGAFLLELDRFLAFLKSRNIEPPAFELCELTYVNHFPAGDGWSSHAEAGLIFQGIEMPKLPGGLVAEDAVVRFRYAVRDADHAFLGRVHFNVTPGVAAGLPIYVLNLMGRGVVSDDIAQTVDACHVWLAAAFKGLTLPAVWQAAGVEHV